MRSKAPDHIPYTLIALVAAAVTAPFLTAALSLLLGELTSQSAPAIDDSGQALVLLGYAALAAGWGFVPACVFLGIGFAAARHTGEPAHMLAGAAAHLAHTLSGLMWIEWGGAAAAGTFALSAGYMLVFGAYEFGRPPLEIVFACSLPAGAVAGLVFTKIKPSGS